MSWCDESGAEVEPPRKESPPSKDNEVRATILFWWYMKEAGIPSRDIAACFGLHHSVVIDHINNIPEDIKEEYGSDDFVGRLREAVRTSGRPKSRLDFRAFLAKLGSVGLQGGPPVSK